MNGEQTLLWATAGGAVALVLLVSCALLWRSSRRLAARIAELEARTPSSASGTRPAGSIEPGERVEPAFVITAIEDAASEHTARPDGRHVVDQQAAPSGQVVAGRIDGRLFADIVARESVVKAAGLVHGLRRALAPEHRNRIRFEMKREVKRSRKQRRSDLKAALRQLREDAA